MPPEDPQDLSETVLASLLGEALRVGASSAPPDPPDWYRDPSFPYIPVSFTGRGGSGFVWKASRRDGHGDVALKLVPFKSDPHRLRQRWEDECSALRKISHPHLVALIDHGLAPDGLSGWLAMEWIAGGSLAEKLRTTGPLPFSAVKSLLPPVAAALDALHQAGLVHRDIKPSNILLEAETQRPVLADLGIAHDSASPEEHRLTRTLERHLTPGFSPPELLSESYQPDALGDQYSLASTLWLLLTGTLPIGAFPKLQRLAKAPEGIDPVLRKALATAPEDRFRDIPAFAAAFRKAASRPPRSYYLVATLVLVFAALSVWFATRPDPFPKHFLSGPIRANQTREHFIWIDSTLHQDGLMQLSIRTASLDPWFGFDGRAHLTLRDKNGNILHQFKADGYGVNGRLIPGAPHDRLDTMKQRIPPEIAARTHTITYAATPSTRSLQTRIEDNQIRFNSDVEKITAGAKTGLNALKTMFTIRAPKTPKTPKTPKESSSRETEANSGNTGSADPP